MLTATVKFAKYFLYICKNQYSEIKILNCGGSIGFLVLRIIICFKIDYNSYFN